MSRWRFLPIWITPVLLGAAAQQQPPAQQLPPDEDAKPAQTKPVVKPPDSDLPPDEDAVATQQQYSFNPVKSKMSLQIGEEYFKKGNNKAAVERFRDATGWNEGNADAWLMLGKAEEKRGQDKAARAAYEKYLQLAGNAKGTAEVRKRLDKLK